MEYDPKLLLRHKYSKRFIIHPFFHVHLKNHVATRFCIPSFHLDSLFKGYSTNKDQILGRLCLTWNPILRISIIKKDLAIEKRFIGKWEIVERGWKREFSPSTI